MRLETVADRRLHPATLISRALKQVPQFALGLPALVGFASEANIGLLLLISLGGIGAALVSAFFVWMRFRYGVGERELVIESGVLHRQRRVIPFDRIQDIDIEQGLLARMFGTAKVRIETGGSAKNEGELDSVALTEALRLRETLRHGQEAAGTSGHESADPAAVGEPLLFRMSPGRVLLAGMFNFSLVSLAFLFGGFQYLEPLFDFDLVEPERWLGPARTAAAGATWLASLLLVLALLLLSLLIGIARTFARDYGFTLTRAPSGLRRRRGLFTLSEVVIPLRRVQLSVIRSGAVARLFGWFRLEFQTLSADAAQSGHQAAAPFARMEELLLVLAEVRPQLLPAEGDYVRVSRRHILRQSLRWLAAAALPLLGGAIFWPPALLLLPLLAVLVGAAALQWRHHRYCLTGDALHVRQGFLTRRLWILPYEKIQAIAVDQGPLQRRLDLATLTPDTAGASLFAAPSIVNLSAPDADALAERLLRLHHEARARLRAPAAGRL